MMTTALNKLFWLIFAAAMGVYATMLIWTLPNITAAAGGLPPFDMRPSGYTFEEARAFLKALSPDGLALYRDVQHKLDMAYPALLGVSLFLGIALLAPKSWGIWGWILGLIAIPAAVFDYLENSMVRFMLFLGPNNINPEIVGWASERTLRKSLFTTAAMSILLILLLVWLWQFWRTRKATTETHP